MPGVVDVALEISYETSVHWLNVGGRIQSLHHDLGADQQGRAGVGPPRSATTKNSLFQLLADLPRSTTFILHRWRGSSVRCCDLRRLSRIPEPKRNYVAGEHEPQGEGALSGDSRRHDQGRLRGVVRRASSSTHALPGADRTDGQPLHKGERVKELVEERGCQLLYLPPYSQDLNPILGGLRQDKEPPAKGRRQHPDRGASQGDLGSQLPRRPRLLKALRSSSSGSTIMTGTI
jgi:hypothetical protein